MICASRWTWNNWIVFAADEMNINFHLMKSRFFTSIKSPRFFLCRFIRDVISRISSSHHITRKSVVGVDRAPPTQRSAREPSAGLSPSVVWVSIFVTRELFCLSTKVDQSDEVCLLEATSEVRFRILLCFVYVWRDIWTSSFASSSAISKVSAKTLLPLCVLESRRWISIITSDRANLRFIQWPNHILQKVYKSHGAKVFVSDSGKARATQLFNMEPCYPRQTTHYPSLVW